MRRRPSGLLFAAVLGLASLIAALPSAAAQSFRVDIPAGRLADAVAALGRQTGASIALRDPKRLPKRSPALHGELSLRAALDRLVAGSGAEIVEVDAATWLVAPGHPRPPQPRRPAMPDVPAVQASPAPDIVVTASKRGVRLADYPGSAVVIDGALIGPAEAKDGTAAVAAREPLLGSTNLGPARDKLFLRGVADSSFNGPSQATVGQYLGDLRINYNGPDPDLLLYDMASVEVLEGPQGTLYGAGSLGGLIRLTPNPADPAAPGRVWAGRVWAGLSATAHGALGGDVGGVLNAPVIPDRLGLRLVAYDVDDGGYIDDVGRGLKDVNRVRTDGGRLSARGLAGDWTIDATVALQAIRSRDSQYAEPSVGGLSRDGAVPQPAHADLGLEDLVLRRDWGPLHLSATAGYVGQRLDEQFDASQPQGGPLLYRQSSRTSLWSGEARLSQDMQHGLGWVAGVDVLDSRSSQTRAYGPFPEPLPLGGVVNRALDLTAYGEATWAPLPRLELTAGGRLSYVRLSGEALTPDGAPDTSVEQVTAARSEGRLLPSLAVRYQLASRLSVYGRYEEGFRPGGIEVGAAAERFDADRVSTAEAGIRYAAGRWSLALTGAHTIWRDVQADTLGGFGYPVTSNIGDGRIWSGDVRASWRPFGGLTLDAAVFAAWSRLTVDSLGIDIIASAPLPNVAPYGGRVGLDYARPLPGGLLLDGSAAVRFVGKSTLGMGPVLDIPQGDYAEAEVAARLSAGRTQVSLSVDNLLDSHADSFSFGTPFTIGIHDQATPLRPRTIRLGVDQRF